MAINDYANPSHKRNAERVLNSYNMRTSTPASGYIISYHSDHYTIKLVINGITVNHSNHAL